MRLMLQGKVLAALHWIGSQRSGRMEITEDVLGVLRKKHPGPAPVVEGAVIQGPIKACRKVLHDNIDGAMIYQADKRTHGTAGPFGLDSEGWSRMLFFKSKSLNFLNLLQCLPKNCVQNSLIRQKFHPTWPAG